MQEVTDESWGIAHVSVTTNTTTSTSGGGLYYLPEQSISDLIGQPAAGLWQLEILDNRTGAGVTNSLDSWQLEFKFANLNYTLTLAGGEPQTNVVNPNSITWYQVNVPTDANFATNELLFASGPVNFLYSPNYPPSTGGAGDGPLAIGDSGQPNRRRADQQPGQLAAGI